MSFKEYGRENLETLPYNSSQVASNHISGQHEHGICVMENQERVPGEDVLYLNIALMLNSVCFRNPYNYSCY